MEGGKSFRRKQAIEFNYPGETTALTAAMPVVKLLLQAAVSENVKVLTMDAKDYYLNTPLTRPKVSRIPLEFIVPSVLDKHHFSPFISSNSALFPVHRGMYGLSQVGFLAQLQLVTHLRLTVTIRRPRPVFSAAYSMGSLSLLSSMIS